MASRAKQLKPLAPRPVSESAAASNLSSSMAIAAKQHAPGQSAMHNMTAANPSGFPGQQLGVPCSPLESVTSVDPKDYVWGTPNAHQQQQMHQQFAQMAFFAFMAQQQALCYGSVMQPQLPFPPFGPGICPMPPAGCFPALPVFPGVMPPCPVAPGRIPMDFAAGLRPAALPTQPMIPQATPVFVPAPAPAPVAEQPLAVSAPALVPTANPAGSAPVAAMQCNAAAYTAQPNEGFTMELNVDDIKKLLEDPDPLDSGTDGSSCLSESVLLRTDSCGVSGNLDAVDSSSSVQSGDNCFLFGPDEALGFGDHDLQAALKEISEDPCVGGFDDMVLDGLFGFGDVPVLASRMNSVDSSEEGSSLTAAGSPVSPAKSPSPKRRKQVSGGVRKTTGRKGSALPVEAAINALQDIVRSDSSYDEAVLLDFGSIVA